MREFKRVTCSVLIAVGIVASGSASLPIAIAQSPATPAAPFNVSDVLPDLPPAVTEASAEPLSVDDCTAPERSREEVVAILKTPPTTSEPGRKPDWTEPEMRPSAPLGAEGAIDGVPVAEIEASLRSWQVCKMLGLTWQQMSLETESFIREDIYGDHRIMTAYSETTLNEILDARVAADTEFGKRQYGPGIVADCPPLAIDIAGTVAISEIDDYVRLEVVSVSEYEGAQSLNAEGFMAFRLVNGLWLVDSEPVR